MFKSNQFHHSTVLFHQDMRTVTGATMFVVPVASNRNGRSETFSMVSVTRSSRVMNAARAPRLPGSQMDNLVSLLTKTGILVFYDKGGQRSYHAAHFSELCRRQSPHTPLLCVGRIIFAAGFPCYSRRAFEFPVPRHDQDTWRASVLKTFTVFGPTARQRGAVCDYSQDVNR